MFSSSIVGLYTILVDGVGVCLHSKVVFVLRESKRTLLVVLDSGRHFTIVLRVSARCELIHLFDRLAILRGGLHFIGCAHLLLAGCSRSSLSREQQIRRRFSLLLAHR